MVKRFSYRLQLLTGRADKRMVYRKLDNHGKEIFIPQITALEWKSRKHMLRQKHDNAQINNLAVQHVYDYTNKLKRHLNIVLDVQSKSVL